MAYTYNAAKNRLLAADNLSFTYDNEGQLATGYGVSYAFDYEHRLTAIGASASFRYDGIGNRLEATRNGVATRYVYDLGGNLIAEADAGNTITRYYIHGIGLVAMVTPAGATYCYHYNQIGSTVALTDMNQAVVNQYAYTPFGEIANQAETIAQPFTFVGQMGVMAEPNGFYYMRARYYDPEVRRFISEDPIGFAGGDLNLYAYAGNNPAVNTDPSGNMTGIGDLLAWGGLKVAQYAVRAITYLAGKPLTSEQISKMDTALMGAWRQTTAATPHAVGAAVTVSTGSRTAGMVANWGSDTLFTLLAGAPSHEITVPPVPIPGAGFLVDIIDGIDILNPTPVANGTLTNSIYGFANIKPTFLK